MQSDSRRVDEMSQTASGNVISRLLELLMPSVPKLRPQPMIVLIQNNHINFNLSTEVMESVRRALSSQASLIETSTPPPISSTKPTT